MLKRQTKIWKGMKEQSNRGKVRAEEDKARKIEFPLQTCNHSVWRLQVINVHKKFWLSLNIWFSIMIERGECNPATKLLKYEEQSLHRAMCFQNIMPSRIIFQILLQNSAFSDSFRLITWWIWVKRKARVGEESIMTWYEVSPKRLMWQSERQGPQLMQPVIERALDGESFALLRDLFTTS